MLFSALTVICHHGPRPWQSEARQTGATSSFFYRDDVDGTSRAFICDIMVSAAESEKYASALSGVRMRQVGTKDVGLPTSLSYMDML